MKYFLYLLFLIQIQNCKSDTVSTSNISLKKEINVDKTIEDNYLINSIDKIAIGKKIEEKNKIEQLKVILKNSFEREVVRPYMSDIFFSENDSLLQFYDYKFFLINGVKFKSYYIKIQYEDGNYENIILVNESLNIEYNTMIVYEELKSEVKYLRNTHVKGDIIEINFKSPNPTKNISFQVKEGMFLDYFDIQVVDEKWGDKKIINSKEIFEYRLKGKAISHFKNGYWIEKRYSFEYDKSIDQEGNYVKGLKDGQWYFSPEGPVDVIKKFDNGRFVSKSYP